MSDGLPVNDPIDDIQAEVTAPQDEDAHLIDSGQHDLQASMLVDEADHLPAYATDEIISIQDRAEYIENQDGIGFAAQEAGGQAVLVEADELEASAGGSESEMAALEEPPQSFTGWLWALLSGRSYNEALLRDLNAALVDYPDSPTNLVLRGELLLKMREYTAAMADFEHALELGARDVPESRWGIVPQVMMDRAAAGLREAERGSIMSAPQS